ncbi:hypothetical protein CWO08_16030 [Vibrio sp. 10N.286.48.B8]|nr:hypothetical protein CWO08_16030 [Vibrio sp. 10N.286.48.B8]
MTKSTSQAIKQSSNQAIKQSSNQAIKQTYQILIYRPSLNTNTPDTKKAPKGAFFLSLRDYS